MPTRQETFDIVARHLLTQGDMAVVDGGCQYRTPDGLRCAAGCLIPDGYSVIEGLDAQRNTEQHDYPVEFAGTWFGHDLDLVCRLQDIHDRYDPDKWADALAALAETECLETTVLEEFGHARR